MKEISLNHLKTNIFRLYCSFIFIGTWYNVSVCGVIIRNLSSKVHRKANPGPPGVTREILNIEILKLLCQHQHQSVFASIFTVKLNLNCWW